MSDAANSKPRPLVHAIAWGGAVALLAILAWQTRPLWCSSPKTKEEVASNRQEPSQDSQGDDRCVHLANGTTDTLEVAAATVKSMHLTSTVVATAHHSDQLRLTGQLTLDPARLVHVHSRFAGEVIRMGMTTAGERSRPIRVGDRVAKGQTLAVLWSKEVGEAQLRTGHDRD